jgi:hypothetical protein
MEYVVTLGAFARKLFVEACRDIEVCFTPAPNSYKTFGTSTLKALVARSWHINTSSAMVTGYWMRFKTTVDIRGNHTLVTSSRSRNVLANLFKWITCIAKLTAIDVDTRRLVDTSTFVPNRTLTAETLSTRDFVRKIETFPFVLACYTVTG